MEINSRKLNDVVIFDIEGDFRRTEIKDVTLHQLVKDQLVLGRKNILFNLAKVTSIDSFCVGEILSSYISIRDMGGKLLRANTSRKIQIIFQVTALETILPNHESIDVALASILDSNHKIKE